MFNAFKESMRKYYSAKSIYELWDNYTAIRFLPLQYKKIGWHEEARRVEAEAVIIIGLMREKPRENKQMLYNEMLDECFMNERRHSSLIDFVEDLCRIDFFKKEIVDRLER